MLLITEINNDDDVEEGFRNMLKHNQVLVLTFRQKRANHNHPGYQASDTPARAVYSAVVLIAPALTPRRLQEEWESKHSSPIGSFFVALLLWYSYTSIPLLFLGP